MRPTPEGALESVSPERTLERALAMEGRAAIDDLRQGRFDEPGRASVGAAAIRLRRARTSC